MLKDTLQSWLGVEKDNIATELIVIDNNSTDKTHKVVEEIKRTHCKDLKYIFEPRAGLSFARNRGIMESDGSIVGWGYG